MSPQLISRSLDLKKLRDEGLSIAIVDGYLVIHRVPYVNSKREIAYGKLVSDLDLSGDQTSRPGTHVVYFCGEQPCSREGVEIPQIKHQTNRQCLSTNLTIDRSFSNKPPEGFSNYYDKMQNYLRIISSPAKSLNPSVTEAPFSVVPTEGQEDIFNYLDTNSSRANINTVTHKLLPFRIGIVGLGGTGSYVLDLIAKTPVKEIHLFDGDDFLQHNAFRSPGAPSLNTLNEKPKKVDYFEHIYSNMRKSIIAHPTYISEETISSFPLLDFVFVCIDDGPTKEIIFKHLENQKISFIDVGIGLEVVDDQIIGIIRTTTSTPKKRDHVSKFVSTGDAHNDEYSKNIQIAELNALNACLAVIKWKKLCGFYQDLEGEHQSTFSINVSQLTTDATDET